MAGGKTRDALCARFNPTFITRENYDAKAVEPNEPSKTGQDHPSHRLAEELWLYTL